MSFLDKFQSYIFVLLFSSLFVFSACDIVEPPYLTETDPGNGGGETIQKVLLEEFTGHQCPNCPEGAAIAESLKQFYGDKLIVVAVHAGFFARTGSAPFTYDFRTPAGEELNSFFAIPHNPLGMVNRGQTDGSRLIPPAGWGSAIEQFVNQEPVIEISLSADYNESDRKLDIDATVTALEALQGNYSLVVMITEDGIRKPQKTNDPEFPEGVDMEYVHDHVLRTAVNGTWGEEIITSMAAAGEKTDTSYSITLDSEWVKDNCSIVVYVYNNEDKQVIQAEDLHLVHLD